MRRAVVDFPQPVSPPMPSVVPASTVNETLSTAETYAFEYSPVRTANCLRSPSTCSRTCDGMMWLYSAGHTETRAIMHLKRCVR